MAANYTREYECGECGERGPNSAIIAACHSQAKPVYVCDVCLECHDTAADAKSCCSQLVGEPSTGMASEPEPVEKPAPFRARDYAENRTAAPHVPILRRAGKKSALGPGRDLDQRLFERIDQSFIGLDPSEFLLEPQCRSACSSHPAIEPVALDP
jgi:hypothetical protein